MAWEWSHTDEAYINAEDNLREHARSWLEIVWAEWKGRALGGEESDQEGFDSAKYEAALVEARDIPEDLLVDQIWEWMSEQRICTNGGHDAYACPYGCSPHLVSFSRKEEDEE